MEPFYYNHMNKNQQAAYRAMQQGLTNLSDEFQIPRLEGKDLSNVFFELRLDHPEIFWASGFKYKYYPDSPNLILIPEYLFDKGKIREHQKAMGARVEKLARPAMKLTELEKERYIHDFICEHVHFDKLKKPTPMRSSDLWDKASASARASPNRSKFFVIRSASGA